MGLPAPPPSSASSDAMFDMANQSLTPIPPTPATVETPPPIGTPAETVSLTQTVAEPAPGATEADVQASEPPAEEPKAEATKAKPKGKAGFSLGGFFKRRASKTQSEPEAPLTPEARKKRRRRKAARVAVPSWGVSFIMHLFILGTLGAVTFSNEAKRIIAKIDSAMVANPGGANELVHIYADPSNAPRDQAVGGSSGASGGGGGSNGGGGGTFGGIGTGPPSATPSVRGGGGGINEKNGLPGVKAVSVGSGLAMLPSAGTGSLDLGGGGMIAGDVTYGTKDIGEALDQLAREILRHLGEHKLTVVWLFDESESMKDDQKTIRQKFDRVSSELKINADGATKKREVAPLNHVIVGFGKDIHYEIKKPTADIDQIGRAIERLKIDDTGVENTMHAITDVIGNYSAVMNKDRRLLIVLVTDESGDDGAYVEEAHQAAMSHGVPIYVIGRQSLFGYHRVRIKYVDPVTKDEFWPEIRRGPETADLEVLQWDGLHDRWDEQPSGFAPYELARLAKDTGGIYFLLPSEETLRLTQREKAYSITSMKELVPDYESRGEYIKRRQSSELRRSLHEIIMMTKGYSFPLGFPINIEEMLMKGKEAEMAATARLNGLLQIEKQMRGLSRLRDREPDKRWQANYDLLLAQIVAYEVKAFEYRACVREMMEKKPKAKHVPVPGKLDVWWGYGHSREPKAPKEDTAKKYAEAEKLYKEVIERYPNTPWSDLAKDEMNRGFSVGWGEHTHVPSPTRAERAKFVPKY